MFEAVAASTEPNVETSRIDVRRTGYRAVVQVSGPRSAAVPRQLAEMLAWLAASGVEGVTVQLATAELIDTALLNVLRAARRCLCGDLLVDVTPPDTDRSPRVLESTRVRRSTNRWSRRS